MLGGDHTITLGELRAHAAVHGPLGLVLLDAHCDTNDAYYGQKIFHGTPFRRAFEEGLIDPARSTMAGMRGSIYDAGEWERPGSSASTSSPARSCASSRPPTTPARVRARAAGGPVFLSFDVDVIDPGYAPGTGTPEVAGLHPYEALRFVRSLTDVALVGFDVVEVSPQWDGPAQPTALLAANVAHAFLALRALRAR